MKIPTGAQFENPPVGSHLARCYEVIDLGTQERTEFATKEVYYQREIRIGWELPNEPMQGLYKPELQGVPFSKWETYKLSLHPKAKLYKLLAGWFGAALTKEQAEEFQIESLLDQPCMLSLVQNDEYINIASVSMVPRGTQMPELWNQIRFFDMDPAKFDANVLASLPEGIKKKIMASPEYRELMSPAAPTPPPPQSPPRHPLTHAPLPQQAQRPVQQPIRSPVPAMPRSQEPAPQRPQHLVQHPMAPQRPPAGPPRPQTQQFQPQRPQRPQGRPAPPAPHDPYLPPADPAYDPSMDGDPGDPGDQGGGPI